MFALRYSLHALTLRSFVAHDSCYLRTRRWRRRTTIFNVLLKRNDDEFFNDGPRPRTVNRKLDTRRESFVVVDFWNWMFVRKVFGGFDHCGNDDYKLAFVVKSFCGVVSLFSSSFSFLACHSFFLNVMKRS